MEISQTLQSARRAQGLTLTALAAAAGVHKSTLSRWESGKSTPFTDELTRVMDALGLPAEVRQACYRDIEAPRAVQAAKANSDAGNLPISTGELLRALRIRAKLTQTDAARAAEVSQALVAQWEKGSSLPSDAHLHALCFAYGVTDDEFAFLVMRGWRQVDPLPMDRDALDGIIRYLEYHDSSLTRSSAYLALAARYHALHRTGKISEMEAAAVYGNYGYWLFWRFGELQTGRRIGAMAVDALQRSRGTMPWGEYDTFKLEMEYFLHTNQVDRAVAFLEGITDRFAPSMYQLWFDYRAVVAEKVGNVDQSIAYYQKSIDSVSTEAEAFHRRKRMRGMLIRNRRFREALPLLQSAPAEESRPIAVADNLLQHAIVFAQLDERRDAALYYARAEALIQDHDLGNLTFRRQAGHLVEG